MNHPSTDSSQPKDTPRELEQIRNRIKAAIASFMQSQRAGRNRDRRR